MPWQRPWQNLAIRKSASEDEEKDLLNHVWTLEQRKPLLETNKKGRRILKLNADEDWKRVVNVKMKIPSIKFKLDDARKIV